MKVDAVVELLKAHRTLGNAPLSELRWLAENGDFQRLEAGRALYHLGERIPSLLVVFSGFVDIRVERGGVWRTVMEWRGGDVTGVLPYSRMQGAPGESFVHEPVAALSLPRERFPELIQECPEITAALVHLMLDRARHFRVSDLQDDKLAALGRLAAGLAHELNNPASAAARSAVRLTDRLAEAEAAFSVLSRAGLSAEELDAFDELRRECLRRPVEACFTPLEEADRADAIGEWLARHGASRAAAEDLAESGIRPADLDCAASGFRDDSLPTAIAALAANCAIRRLVAEIVSASGRVHELVTAIKGFTYMDQSTAPQPVNLARGLADTMTLLRPKARHKSVSLDLQVADNLPQVVAVGGELNQVWANLLENAIDAVSEGGSVRLSAGSDGKSVEVRVVDDGPGIPEAIRARLFEPFFTTKPVGEGTGLGLAISRHLVRQHFGELDVDSRPGRTEFVVTLPAATPETTNENEERPERSRR